MTYSAGSHSLSVTANSVKTAIVRQVHQTEHGRVRMQAWHRRFRIGATMRPKKLFVLYWVFTAVAVLIFGTAGVVCLFRIDGVPKVIGGLGYPAYFTTFLGLTNLLGVSVVLLPVPKTLREWAYAGLTFDILAAIFSLLSSGHPVVHITDPVIALIALQGSYLCWRKRCTNAGSI